MSNLDKSKMLVVKVLGLALYLTNSRISFWIISHALSKIILGTSIQIHHLFVSKANAPVYSCHSISL